MNLNQIEQRLGFTLRDFQAEATEALTTGDTIVSAPTGEGKTAIYHAATWAGQGLTVVVAPIVALIREQTERFESVELQCVGLHGATRGQKRTDALQAVADGNARALVTTAESLRSNEVVKAIKAGGGCSLLVVDEAHAFEQWADSFRPAYRQLGRTSDRIGTRRVLMCSATLTATGAVKAARSLDRYDWHVTAMPSVRPNLTYRSAELGNPPALRLDSGPGIVYCVTTALAETLSGVSGAPCYHGGLSAGDQKKALAVWADCGWIVATKALGMGIDRADLRTVIHAQLPASLIDYAQETGRAGRDGHPAECFLNANDGQRSARFLTMSNYPHSDLIRAYWAFALEHGAADGLAVVPTKEFAALHRCAYETVSAIKGWLSGSGCLYSKRDDTWEIDIADNAEGMMTGRNADKKQQAIRALRSFGRAPSARQVAGAFAGLYRDWRGQLKRMASIGAVSFKSPERRSFVKLAGTELQFDWHALQRAQERAEARLRAMADFGALSPEDRPQAITEAVSLNVAEMREELGRLKGMCGGRPAMSGSGPRPAMGRRIVNAEPPITNAQPPDPVLTGPGPRPVMRKPSGPTPAMGVTVVDHLGNGTAIPPAGNIVTVAPIAFALTAEHEAALQAGQRLRFLSSVGQTWYIVRDDGARAYLQRKKPGFAVYSLAEARLLLQLDAAGQILTHEAKAAFGGEVEAIRANDSQERALLVGHSQGQQEKTA